MNVSDFHATLAAAQLDDLMRCVRRYTEQFGAILGYAPLTQSLGELAEWLDTYERGEANRDSWRKVMLDATAVEQETNWQIDDARWHDQREWQLAKLHAAMGDEGDAIGGEA